MDLEQQARFLERIQAHQGAIRKVAALYAHDAADREDLFQEITLQLWRSFGSFRGESAFSTFLYRVALNTALLRVRRASRRPEAETGRELDEVAGPEAPSNDPERDEEVERLYAAIRQLPPIDRAVALLVLEEKKHEEIAAVTGLSVGNVSVRLFRAKERLRRLLNAPDHAKEGTPCSTTS